MAGTPDLPKQHLRDGGGAEHPLPVPADPHHGALDQEGLHPHPAAPPRHAPPAQQEPSVSTNYQLSTKLRNLFYNIWNKPLLALKNLDDMVWAVG